MTLNSFPCIPAKAGTRSFGRGFASPDAPPPTPAAHASQKHWVPALAGMSGEYA